MQVNSFRKPLSRSMLVIFLKNTLSLDQDENQRTSFQVTSGSMQNFCISKLHFPTKLGPAAEDTWIFEKVLHHKDQA